MSSFRMNRREFIAAIGAAAFAAVANTRAVESLSVAATGMQKRAIPSSGEQLPVIGMGTSGTFDVGATDAGRAPLVEVLRLSWACLLKRVFNIDLEHCPHCGGTLKIIATILYPTVIAKILTYLGLPARAPPRSLARSFGLLSMA